MTLCELPNVANPTTCAEACSDLYDCGALVCNGMQNCPGVTGDPAEKTQFLQICLPTCMNQMALISIIDPTDCDGTVATISAVSAQFNNVCQNGLP